MRRFLLALCLLAGCADAACAELEPREVVLLALDTYEDMGSALAWRGELEAVPIGYGSGPDFLRLCHSQVPIRGCFVQGREVIYLSLDVDHGTLMREVLPHEMGHAIQWVEQAVSDHEHRDEFVWGQFVPAVQEQLR